MGPAEKRLVAAKIEHKALRKKFRQMKDNVIKKQIKRLESMFPMLKREAYLEKKRMVNELEEIKKSDEIEKLEKQRLQELSEAYLKKKQENKSSLIIGSSSIKSRKICNSCGSPLKDVYGIIRCKCN